jgi:hypothetical protein
VTDANYEDLIEQTSVVCWATSFDNPSRDLSLRVQIAGKRLDILASSQWTIRRLCDFLFTWALGRPQSVTLGGMELDQTASLQSLTAGSVLEIKL